MSELHPKPTNSIQREKQRALALAALIQSAYLVECIAQEGKVDLQQFRYFIDALLDEDYLADRHFSTGISKTKHLLQGKNTKFAKHLMSVTSDLIRVEKELSKRADLLSNIGTGMERIKKQSRYFGDVYHENVISSVAHLYGETISTLKNRVIVRGKPEHLKHPHNTEQVRSLLFSGVRAAWVWRTNGGNTLHLLFGRKKLIKQLESLEMPQ